jgi:hypothetical protein
MDVVSLTVAAPPGLPAPPGTVPGPAAPALASGAPQWEQNLAPGGFGRRHCAQ